MPNLLHKSPQPVDALIWIMFIPFLLGCSVDTSLLGKTTETSSAPTYTLSLTSDRELLKTDIASDFTYTTDTTPAFTINAPTVVGTTNMIAYASVVQKGNYPISDNFATVVRPQGYNSPVVPAALALGVFPNYDGTAEYTLNLSASTDLPCTLSGSFSSIACILGPLMLPVSSLVNEVLSASMGGSNSNGLSTKTYNIRPLTSNLAGQDEIRTLSDQEFGGELTSSFRLFMLGTPTAGHRSFYESSPGNLKLIYDATNGYDFLKPRAVLGNRVLYSGSKPANPNYTGLFLSDTDMTFFKQVIRLNANYDDLSMFGTLDAVEYRGKIYVVLGYANSFFSFYAKIFRMDLDGNNFEQITNFFPGNFTDDVTQFVVFKDKIYFSAKRSATATSKLFTLETDMSGGNLTISTIQDFNAAATSDDITLTKLNEDNLYLHAVTSTGVGIFRLNDDQLGFTKIFAPSGTKGNSALTVKNGRMFVSMREDPSDSDKSLFLYNPQNNTLTLLADLESFGNYWSQWDVDDLLITDSKIYFPNYSPSEMSPQLFSTNLNGEGLTQETTGLMSLSDFATVGNRVFFVADSSIISISKTVPGDLQEHVDTWTYPVDNSTRVHKDAATGKILMSSETYIYEISE